MTIRKSILLILSAILISSCTEKFEEINTNPNNPETADIDYVFNYVIKEAAGEYGIVNAYNYTYVQRWVMQTAAVWGNSTMPPYTLFDQYRIQNLWEYYYSNLLVNTELLIRMTAENDEDVNRHQVARIWKVFVFHRVTDLWGDVPYSDAWNLLDEYTEETIRPSYDTQENIYMDMLSILEDAAEKIDKTAAFYTNDMIFDGDLDSWIKFANSLRLRLAVRSGNEEVVDEIIADDQLISDNSEAAYFTFIETQDWWNPYYEINISSKNPTSPELTGTTTPKVSELMMLQLKNTDDPRLPVYAQTVETDNSSYRGVPNLMDANRKENQAMGMGVASTSYLGKYFASDPTWTKPLLGYPEVCFLRAEAAQRGWTNESAQNWYEEGIRSALEYYEIEDSLINEYLINGDPYDGTIEQIITQKWVALFLDGWEAFAEYRRTGYPQLKKYDLELDGIRILDFEWVDVPRSYVPGRLPYPDDENDLNHKNYQDAVDRMGGDSYYQQVWWSEKFGEVGY
jgi:hypothetical protein